MCFISPFDAEQSFLGTHGPGECVTIRRCVDGTIQIEVVEDGPADISAAIDMTKDAALKLAEAITEFYR